MSEERWTWRSERVIPSKTGAGGAVLQEVLSQLEQYNWPQRDIFSVHLALEEALVNAIKHGNRHDITKKVHVACSMTPKLLRIEITDEGQGFDPSTLPDPTDEDHIDAPSGRGVMLMRSFMSRVEYNEAGNHVIMEKEPAKDE